jgi:methionine-rich copper-binding protein CopC
MKLRIFFVLCALACPVMPAMAHAFLEHASPGAGATPATAPKEIDLEFSEALEPSFSGMDVTDAGGHSMEAAHPVVNGASMRVSLKPLATGAYHVAWHAVSKDTHRTDGAYGFTVK